MADEMMPHLGDHRDRKMVETPPKSGMSSTPEPRLNSDWADNHPMFARMLEFLGEHGAGYLAAPRIADDPDSSTRH